MNFAFNEEQQELRKSVRKFLEDKSPISEVRKTMESDSGVDEKLWAQGADQLGICAIAIPEMYGGLGYGYVEQGIVLEELGRALAPIPYFSSVILGANALLLSADEDAKREFLPKIATGERHFAVAALEDPHNFGVSQVDTRAETVDGLYRLFGTKRYVIDGTSSSDLLVFASIGDQVSMFHARRDTPGVVVEQTPSLDLTRRLATVYFDNVEAELVGELGGGVTLYNRLMDVACCQLANEMMGGAQRVLEMAVDYAKVRIQFGRPIGSFQAIKH